MRVLGCEGVRLPLSPTLLCLCSYANFRAFFLGAILVHARHRETIDVLNEGPQPDLIENWVIAVFVGSGCHSGLKEGFIFYMFRFGTLDFEQCNR